MKTRQWWLAFKMLWQSQIKLWAKLIFCSFAVIFLDKNWGDFWATLIEAYSLLQLGIFPCICELGALVIGYQSHWRTDELWTCCLLLYMEKNWSESFLLLIPSFKYNWSLLTELISSPDQSWLKSCKVMQHMLVSFVNSGWWRSTHKILHLHFT